MTVFVDTSAWFAASNDKDRHHQRAMELLDAQSRLMTSTFVLLETWLLPRNKMSFAAAEEFAASIRAGAATLAHATAVDLAEAWQVPAVFDDQRFSLVDRTSFAMMERLGITKVISFDADFVIYRYGPNRDRAFEVLR